jgi:hypothetical protein
MSILALGLILFSAGLRAYHAHPFPTEERAGAISVHATVTHTHACSVCVASVPQLVLEPRAPALTPPDDTSVGISAPVFVTAAGQLDAGGPIRAPPAA